MIRHGDGGHFMRPDRVYRTSVIAPMTGYQPQRDVNAVAMMFTQGAARGMMLEGLGAMPGPLARLKARIQAWIAERKAAKFAAVDFPRSPPFVPPTNTSTDMTGSAAMAAVQVAPHLAHQMTGVVNLMQTRYGAGYPGMAAGALVSRPIGRWYL